MPCTPATVAAAGEVEAAAAQKAGDGERTDDAVEAPTRTVVARPQPAAGGDGSNATAADCSTPARGCYRYGQKGHRIADCTEKLLICSRCNGRGHTTQCLPTSNEEPALAVTSEVWARPTTVTMVRSRLQLSRPKRQSSAMMWSAEWGMEGCHSRYQVGDEAWICDR